MRLAAAVAAVLLLPGCGGVDAASTPSARPPLGHVQVADLPHQPPHADADTAITWSSQSGDPADPETAASRVIVDGLIAQGLTVTDVGTEPIRDTGTGTAVVVVAATYTSPDGRSHTSVYEVELHRRDDGSWTVRPGGHR